MDKTDALIISVTLIVVVVFTAWWLSQEWQACTKLHDNIPAQIICFGYD